MHTARTIRGLRLQDAKNLIDEERSHDLADPGQAFDLDKRTMYSRCLLPCF